MPPYKCHPCHTKVISLEISPWCVRQVSHPSFFIPQGRIAGSVCSAFALVSVVHCMALFAESEQNSPQKEWSSYNSPLLLQESSKDPTETCRKHLYVYHAALVAYCISRDIVTRICFCKSNLAINKTRKPRKNVFIFFSRAPRKSWTWFCATCFIRNFLRITLSETRTVARNEEVFFWGGALSILWDERHCLRDLFQALIFFIYFLTARGPYFSLALGAPQEF